MGNGYVCAVALQAVGPRDTRRKMMRFGATVAVGIDLAIFHYK